MTATFDVHDLRLAPPALGEAQVRHDRDFTQWDHAFDDIRDTINFGIRQLNHLPGCDLPTLPEESLEELLVMPFSGDYLQIRQNADACQVLARAFSAWSGNLAGLGLRIGPVWQGEAGAACLGQLACWSAIAEAAGLLIAGGAVVFEGLACFSERIAVLAQEQLVRLAEALARLARRIGTKLAGAGGVVATVVDVARHGTHVFTDLIDDVQLVLDLVDRIRGLADEVRSKVDEVSASLRELGRLRDLVRDVLPRSVEGLAIP